MTEDENTQQPVQITTSYETVVDTLPEAWSFIMDAIERVGPDPSVHIHPASTAPPPLLRAVMGDRVEFDTTRKFHVQVEGMVTKARTEVSAL